MSGDVKDLARLCDSIFHWSLTGQQDSTFYKDVDEAISLAKDLAESEDSAGGAAQLREIERRMKRIKSRRRNG